MGILSGFISAAGEQAKRDVEAGRERKAKEKEASSKLAIELAKEERESKRWENQQKVLQSFEKINAERTNKYKIEAEKRKQRQQEEDNLALRKRIAANRDIDPESNAAYQLAEMAANDRLNVTYDPETDSLVKKEKKAKFKEYMPIVDKTTGTTQVIKLMDDGSYDVVEDFELPQDPEKDGSTAEMKNRAATVKGYMERHNMSKTQAETLYDRLKHAQVSASGKGVDVFQEMTGTTDTTTFPTAEEQREAEVEAKRELPRRSVQESQVLTNAYYEDAPYTVDNENSYLTALADRARIVASEFKIPFDEALKASEGMLMPNLTLEKGAFTTKEFFPSNKYNPEEAIPYDVVIKWKKKYPNASLTQIINKLKAKAK